MIYTVEKNLVVDDEWNSPIDIGRAVQLINSHHDVACGSFEDAELILLGLGFTPASAATILEAARNTGKDEILEEQHALPW